MGLPEYLEELKAKEKELKDQYDYYDSHLNEIDDVQKFQDLARNYHLCSFRRTFVTEKMIDIIYKKLQDYKTIFSMLKSSNNEKVKELYINAYRNTLTDTIAELRKTEAYRDNEELKNFDVRKVKSLGEITDFQNKFLLSKEQNDFFDNTLRKYQMEKLQTAIEKYSTEVVHIFKLKEEDVNQILEEAQSEDIYHNPLFNPTKTMDNLITEVKNNIYADDDIKNELDFVNNEMLIKQHPLKLKLNSDIGDYYCDDLLGRNGKNVVTDYQKEDNYKKDLFVFDNKGRANTNPLSHVSTGDIINGYNDTKYAFSDETKKILKDVFKLIYSIKNLDGTNFFPNDMPLETPFKEYVFMPLFIDRMEAKKILEQYKKDVDLNFQPDQSDLKEDLFKVTKHFKETTKIYQQMMDKISELGLDDYAPGNVSTSRNEFAPSFIMDEPIKNARCNGLYQFLKLINDSGLTIDEFLDDVDKGVNTYFKKLEKYSIIDKTVRKPSLDKRFPDPLMFMLNGPYNNNFDTLLNFRLSEVSGSREIAMLEFIEKDPELNKHNIEKNLYINKAYCENATKNFMNVGVKFFTNDLESETNIQTLKNIIVAFHDDTIPVVSLSTNLDLIDPFTNKKMDKLDYHAYLKNEKTDYKKILEALEKYETSKNVDKRMVDLLNQVCTDVAKDMLASRDLENEPYFEKIVKYSGPSLKEYYEKQAGGAALSDYLLDHFNEKMDNHFDKDNAISLFNNLSCLNDKYYSRNWFARNFLPAIFNPSLNKEWKAIKAMKKSLKEAGVTDETVNAILDKKESIDSLTKKFESGALKPYQKQVEVNNNMNKSNINKPKELNKETSVDVNKEKESINPYLKQFNEYFDGYLEETKDITELRKKIDLLMYNDKEHILLLMHLADKSYDSRNYYVEISDKDLDGIYEYIKSGVEDYKNPYYSKVYFLNRVCSELTDNAYTKHQEQFLSTQENILIGEIKPVKLEDNKEMLDLIGQVYQDIAKNEYPNENARNIAFTGKLLEEMTKDVPHLSMALSSILYGLYYNKDVDTLLNDNFAKASLKDLVKVKTGIAYVGNLSILSKIKLALKKSYNIFDKIEEKGLDNWLKDMEEKRVKIDYSKSIDADVLPPRNKDNAILYQHLINKFAFNQDKNEYANKIMDAILSNEDSLYEMVRVMKGETLINQNSKIKLDALNNLNVKEMVDQYKKNQKLDNSPLTKAMMDIIKDDCEKRIMSNKTLEDVHKKVIGYEDIPSLNKEDSLFFKRERNYSYQKNMTKDKYCRNMLAAIFENSDKLYQGLKVLKDSYQNGNPYQLDKTLFNKLDMYSIIDDIKDNKLDLVLPLKNAFSKLIDDDYDHIIEMEKAKEEAIKKTEASKETIKKQMDVNEAKVEMDGNNNVLAQQNPNELNKTKTDLTTKK